MSQPVFLMVEASPNPNEISAMQSYLGKAPLVTKEHGGVPVATYDVAGVYDNNDKPAVFAVISFPSKEAIDNLFSDPAYEALVPERDRGFSHLRYYIVNERI